MADLPVLLITATREYSATPGVDAIRSTFGGPLIRQRVHQRGTSATLTVQWRCSPSEYNYFMAFFRRTLAMGTLPYLASVILQGAAPEQRIVRFVGNLSLSRTGPNLFNIAATLDCFAG